MLMTVFLFPLIMLLLFVAIGLGFQFPPLKVAPHLRARNKIFKVTMPPINYYASEKLWRGVLAQETAEPLLANILGWIASIITAILILIMSPTFYWWFILYPPMVHFIVASLPYGFFDRQFDLTGHTVETLYVGWDDHIASEAARMQRDPKFRSWGLEKTIERMEKRRWLARLLLKVVRRAVEKAKG